jgi:hypothetical protein
MERLSTETTQKSLVTAFLVFFPLVSIEAINSPALTFSLLPSILFLFWLVLHIPGVEHLPAFLASVIAHDFAFCIMVIFQGFNWFYIIPLG